MRTIGRPEKNICTLSSHRATRDLWAKVPSYRAPVRALCQGSMRIELRSELCAKGALCGSTKLCKEDKENTTVSVSKVLCVCIQVERRFQQFFSHITTVLVAAGRSILTFIVLPH